MAGRFCAVEPFNLGRHGDLLIDAFAHAQSLPYWTYLHAGRSAAGMPGSTSQPATRFHVVEPAGGGPAGIVTFLDDDEARRTIGLGLLDDGSALFRTRPGVEAIMLMLRHVFSRGYRRCGWILDDADQRGHAAASRFAFRLEGVQRNAVPFDGSQRDLATYAVTQAEWPHVARLYETWLDDTNFDADGHPIRTIRQLREVADQVR